MMRTFTILVVDDFETEPVRLDELFELLELLDELFELLEVTFELLELEAFLELLVELLEVTFELLEDFLELEAFLELELDDFFTVLPVFCSALFTNFFHSLSMSKASASPFFSGKLSASFQLSSFQLSSAFMFSQLSFKLSQSSELLLFSENAILFFKPSSSSLRP